MLRRPSAPFRALLSLVALVLLTTACTPVADVKPAQNAADPQCAQIMVAMPDVVAEQKLRETDSQGTAAWGDPSKLIVRCGVTPPGPTTERCVSVNGVDWILTEGDPAWTATTYGRTPALEAVFDPDEIPSSTVLVELGSPVQAVPQDNKCLSIDQSEEVPRASAARSSGSVPGK